jgi:hypothetical protein
MEAQEFFYATHFRKVAEPFDAAFPLQHALPQRFDRKVHANLSAVRQTVSDCLGRAVNADWLGHRFSY